jgi:putative hemolysin
MIAKYLALALTLGLVVTGCSPGSVEKAGIQNPAAAEYCSENGGVVETRYPFYGTNQPNPLRLAGSMQVCVFTSQEDDSSILIALDTLYTDQPTLAALAYRAQTPLAEGQPSVNPSSIYCTQLGGTDTFGGISVAGGGWGREGAEDVISMCVFPDLSSIDSWGLTYHSDDTIRGADLTDLIRYQP